MAHTDPLLLSDAALEYCVDAAQPRLTCYAEFCANLMSSKTTS